MTIITDLGDVLQGLFTMLLNLVTEAFKGVVAIFWIPASTGVEGGFTIYGVFLLIGFSFMILMLAIRFITGLIRK